MLFLDHFGSTLLAVILIIKTSTLVVYIIKKTVRYLQLQLEVQTTTNCNNVTESEALYTLQRYENDSLQ